MNPAFAARAAPFLAAGVLQPVDVHTVDLLAAHVGERDADVLLGLAFAVRAPRAGHVGAELERLRETVVEPSSVEQGVALRALPWPTDPTSWAARVRACALVGVPDGPLAPFVAQGRLVYTRRYWEYEQRLRAAVLARAAAPEPGPPCDDAAIAAELAALFPEPDAQQLAALVAVLRPLSVISGGPGTGKTFTVKKVLALLHARWAAAGAGEPRVALAAPTGKAAARMTQAIREDLGALELGEAASAFLVRHEAVTLHRLLGWDPRHPTRFRHGAARPLPHDVVVVDEASMIDLALFAKLVEAVRPGARLVLMGDRDQLASVEAGSVLADLTAGAPGFSAAMAERVGSLGGSAAAVGAGATPIAASASALADGIVRLTRARRYGEESAIGRVARAIAGGEVDAAIAALLDAGALVAHGPAGELSADVRAEVVSGYRPALAALARGPEGEGEVAFHARVLELFDRFRVLAAHRRGPLGVEGLNAAITDALACEALVRPRGETWVGRPVLITQNSYDVGRANGDVGVLVRRASGAIEAAFPSASGGVAYLPPARLPPHETVFAMTVHKSQGSQFAHPLVVLPQRPSPILTRELVYTAITRARERVTVVGDVERLREALGRTVQRASGLAGLLWGADQPESSSACENVST